MTLAQWVPTLAGIWLPVGTRIAFEESPKLTRHALVIPDLRYLVEECEIARIENVTLSHPSRWQLDIGALDLNSVCLSKIPQSAPSTVAPKTLAQWQAVLPNTADHSPSHPLAPQQWQGELKASLTPSSREIAYKGERVSIQGTLRGQTLSVSQFDVQLPDQPQPIKLVGSSLCRWCRMACR